MDSVFNTSILIGPSQPLVTTPLYKVFENIATTTATNNTALVFEAGADTRTYTYGHLNSIANRLSKTILKIVLENRLSANDDGDFIVAVSMNPSDYLVIILLAILKAGAAYLPLDPTFPHVRVQYICEEVKPVLVISDEDGRHFGNIFKLTIRELLSSAEDLLSNPAVQEDSLSKEQRLKHQEDGLIIVILYTSGSTGTPKGVRITNTSILNRLQWQYQTFPISKTETMGILKSALTFVDGVSEIWGPLLNGLGVVVVSKNVIQNPEEFVKVLERHKIERITLVPSHFKTIFVYLNLQGHKHLQNLRTWVCGGEPVPISIAQAFCKYFLDDQHQLCNSYGSTEVMGDVTYHVVARSDLNHPHKVSIGTSVVNTIVYLLDNDFVPVRVGEIGEIFIAGISLPAGYVNGRHEDKFYNNPFSEDPQFARLFRTGDFAKIENGILWYEGRSDSQVKVRGHRVNLSEVEKVVNEIPGVVKGVVLCHKPGEDDQKILAFVASDGPLNVEHIEKALKTNLVSYMLPQVVLVKRIPLMINGKVDRQGLLKNYESSRSGASSDTDYTGVSEDQMEAARVLFEIVASFSDKTDGISRSIDSNFYESGGTSLNSILTIAKLREAGYHISIGDFINACNLGEVLSQLSLNNVDTAARFSTSASYQTKPLHDKHKGVFTDIIYTSFYNKSSVDYWFRGELSYSDYKEMIDKYWKHLIEENFSFVVENSDGKVVGVAWNQDFSNEPEIKLNSKLTVIFEMIKQLEKEVWDDIAPTEGTTLYAAMVGTSSELSPKENVEVIMFIEDETLELAKRHKFKGVLAANSSLLTQQLATNVYGCKTYIDYPINQYVIEDGTKPFGLAPDSQRVLLQWKELNFGD